MSLVRRQKSRQKQNAAFPTVLHLTSHARPNGPPSWERRRLMKNKFMDVEQLRHTDISGINEEFIFSCCFFLPELFLEEPFQGTGTVKRAPLHVWQRQSAHVSNSITQTSFIPPPLLASPRVAASSSWPPKSLVHSVASEENGGKKRGSAGKLASFFHQVSYLRILLIHKDTYSVWQKSPSWPL